MLQDNGKARVLAGLVGLAAFFGGGAADAQSYPTKPIQVIVPFAGGAASDVLMRIVLDHMGNTIGQRFIVDNRPGAGGNVGTMAGKNAEPDGYTLVMSASGPLAANRSLVRNLGYDPEKDFEPIGLFAHLPNIVVVTTQLPIRSIAELVSYAKARPKELNYGSVGVGSSQHLAGVFFEQLTGVELIHVPYRNLAQYGPDLISGTVHLGFQWYPNVAAPLKAGGARALAVASDKRLAVIPDVPTSAEVGLPTYLSSGWIALLAPRGTPKDIVAKLHRELTAAMNDPHVRDRFAELGAHSVAGTPEALREIIVSDTKKWGEIISRGGVSMAQ